MVDLFKRQSEVAFADFLDSIKDLDERGSWTRLAVREGDYLHTDGSILGQVTHVAGCKVLYASAAFRGFELRLRDVTDRTIQIGTSWDAALGYLHESHQYWMESWQALSSLDLESEADTNWGDKWPVWKILGTVIGHDHYHAGQIALIRSVASPAETPPPPMSDEEIDFLKTFSAW
jgi:hypothetical protein